MKLKILSILLIVFFISACGKGGDARKIEPNVKDRQKQNIEEGRGFRLGSAIIGKRGGEFDFASSNELWRASLDTLEFMPLALANYSGGIIVTDWYSDGSSKDESIKISIRFLSNEIRSDALSIKIFYKNCSMSSDCKVTDRSGELANELTKKILTQAAVYEKQGGKKKEKYIRSDINK